MLAPHCRYGSCRYVGAESCKLEIKTDHNSNWLFFIHHLMHVGPKSYKLTASHLMKKKTHLFAQKYCMYKSPEVGYSILSLIFLQFPNSWIAASFYKTKQSGSHIAVHSVPGLFEDRL